MLKSSDIFKTLLVFFFLSTSLFASYNQEIHNAIRGNDIEILKYITKQYNEYLNEKDPFGTTPLHLAVRKDDTQMIKFILAQNPIINTQDNFGDTPLIDSAKNNNMDIVKLLICYGADKDMKNTYGKSAMDFISKNEQYEIALFIQNPECDNTEKIKTNKLVEKLRKLK